MSRIYTTYCYAYTAYIGKVGEPIQHTIIGEVTARAPKVAVNMAKRQVRQTFARWPRILKMSRGQFCGTMECLGRQS